MEVSGVKQPHASLAMPNGHKARACKIPAAPAAAERPENASQLAVRYSNGKENGNYRGYIGIMGYIVGLYRDNGKENGNYYQ